MTTTTTTDPDFERGPDDQPVFRFTDWAMI